MPNPESFSTPPTSTPEEPPIALGNTAGFTESTGEREAARQAVERAGLPLKRLLKNNAARAAAVVLALLTVTAASAGLVRAKSAPQATPNTSTTDGPETGGPATPTPVSPGSTDPEQNETFSLVSYDYHDWADTEHKTSPNAFGTSRADCYGDREKTEDEFIKTAEDLPEALASYKGAFFEDEQRELGIDQMSEKELDDFLSNTKDPKATKLQKMMLEKLSAIAKDKENSRFDFYHEDATENTYFAIWFDDNGDGIQTPQEMHLAYSCAPRYGAPQTDLWRVGPDGKWHKMLDLNLYCRFQPNLEAPPADLQFIPDEEPSDPQTPSPTPLPPTPETPPNDAKDPEAIERNMQTGKETSNYVTQLGTGTPASPRPDTSSDSYKAEISVMPVGGTSNSASGTGQTIDEIIAGADQTYASHENRNPNLDTGESAIIDQNNANETAEAMKPEAQVLETITDEDAAEWFKSLNQGGGN